MNKEINNSRKKILFCAVCGKQCESRNYCVISCASCKQFFRRTVVQQKATTCRRHKKCDIINGEKCRGCRLDKCLIEGMDPLMVKTTDKKCRKEFIEMLEKRRNKLHQTINTSTNIHQQDEEKNLNDGNENLKYNEDKDEIICSANKYRKSTTNQIKNKLDNNDKIISQQKQNYLLVPLNAENSQMEHLIQICEAQSRIRNSFMEFDEQQFLSLNLNSLHDLLTNGPNIILKASEFSETPKLLSSTEFYEINAKFDQINHRTVKCLFVEKLVCIGIFKSLPVYPKLDVKDQLIIIKYVANAVLMICNCFIAYELCSDTWMRKDGSCVMAAFSDQFKFKTDKTLYSLAMKAFTRPIEPFFRIGICKEEFSLILAIMYLNSDIPGLSESARDILSIELSKYTKMLFNYLQNKLGQDAGIKKYAECFHLIANSYFGAKNIDLLITYQETFYKYGEVRDMMPDCPNDIV
uniref:Uncharacterized protein n=1 Tax=Meloidogyne enterolobii TaxID=390850 RepID=A0A6V7VKK8_MELEN|nr:unnamed protein product [Meloidogyne enterolobii]